MEIVHSISVKLVNEKAKILVTSYQGFVRHAPKMLRDSMMLAYTTAVDDMLRAMDASKITAPIEPEKKPHIVLLDQNGNAT